MHFSVAVITNDENESVDDLLEQYGEEYEGAQVIEIDRTKEEIIQEMKSKRTADFFLNRNIKDNHDTDAIMYSECKTDEDYFNFYKECHSPYSEFDDEGNEISTNNPNATWDWYCIGGRWSGCLLHTKDGNNVDRGYISNIDFDFIDDDRKKLLKTIWEVKVEGKPLDKKNDNYFYVSFDKRTGEEIKEKYKTLEEFIKAEGPTDGTYSVVTPDGVWWDNVCSEKDRLTFKKIAEKYKDCYITIVDCHI